MPTSRYQDKVLETYARSLLEAANVAEEDEDVVGVTVTTAIPLDDELRQTITKKCEQDFGRKVFLIEQVDPSIVGGLVLEARGERRDISVKTQLRIAQETLANSANSYGGEA